jgi:cell division septation protein DedD
MQMHRGERMPNSFKNTWWIFLLIVSGGIILILSLHPNKTQNDQGVVLNDIFPKESNPVPTAPAVPTPVPPMAVVKSPINGHEAGFTIQVYSFQDRKRAETALKALKNSGYQAFLSMNDKGKKGVWYRVRVGGIGDKAAAHIMLEDIRKKYKSGFILKTKN